MPLPGATKTGYYSLFLSSGMAIFGLLVADRPIEMNATRMLKSAPKKPKPQTKQKVWVMKNNLTEQEMDEAGERWLNHEGPYMTLAETLAHAAERAKKADQRQSASQADLSK